MRSLRSATCTSGDPVSPSCVLYSPMIPVLRSLVKAIDPPRTAQELQEHQAAVLLLILGIQRLNILNQYNLRVQKPRGALGRSQADQRAARIQQPDPFR